MKCTCITDVEAKLKEAGYEDAEIKGKIFTMPNFEMRLGVSVEYYERMKNGEKKKRPTVLTLTPSYCPFCGKVQADKPPEARLP